MKIQNKNTNRIYGIVDYCPPDISGEELNEYGYIYHCPNCDKEFDDCSHTKYCSECGQFLDWE